MRHLDAFAGIGGFSLAAEKAGITTVGFIEREPFCRAVLRKHWPSTPIFTDIKQFRGDEVEDVQLLTAGFPCQPYSIAGKRKGSDDERALWPELARVIKSVKPTWVLGENVGGLESMALDQILAELQGQGYEAMPIWAPAAAAGAPHKRERVFIVALSDVAYGDRQRRKRLNDYWWSDSQWKDFMGHAGRRITSYKARWPAGPGETAFAHEKVRLTRAEPGMGGAVHGLPYGVDGYFRIGRKPRLRALGNAVVPHQVFPIISCIKQLHDFMTSGEVK